MKKNVIIAISAAVLVLALAVGAFFAFGNKSGEETPDPTATAAATPVDKSVGTAEPTVAPSPKTSEQVKSEVDNAKANAYKDATGVANFDKEQVQQVLGLAHDYSNVALSSPYFLSGKWYENGLKMDEVDNYIGKYFDLDLRKAIRGIDTTSANKNVYKDVATLMYYLDKTPAIGPHPNCAEDANPANAAEAVCPPVVKFSKMDYVPTVLDGENGIQVSYTASAEIPLSQNGLTKFITVSHDVKLNFILNKNYEPTTDPNKFVINYYDIKLTTSQLHDSPVYNNGGK